ncbi:MAG: succinylglutamate desuccinylase/aspartoacylase family protein [Bacillota bacterium]|nr:succinylglutamate desuccinylase/aspartoacylase family protein [Bacillota bacterium]
MKNELTVGTAAAKPGTKATGWVNVGTRPDDTPLSIPVIVLNGTEDGPVFSVNASVHGDEHEGVAAVLQLSKTLDPRELRGALILVPSVNLPAFEAMRRGNPEDVYVWDLNRTYPGSDRGFLTERIAAAHLNEIEAKADYSVSLHCGANYFYLIGKVLYEDEASKELAKAFGPDWKYLWEGRPFRQTLKSACISRGVKAVTLELGGNGNRLPGVFRRNVDTMVKGVLNAMKHFGMVEGAAEYPEEWIVIEETQVTANRGGLLLADPLFAFEKRVPAGTTVMRVYNVFGDEVEEIKAPFDGVLMGLRTYPAVHTGDWTLFIGKVKRVEKR